jgi:hypothetical protein
MPRSKHSMPHSKARVAVIRIAHPFSKHRKKDGHLGNRLRVSRILQVLVCLLSALLRLRLALCVRAECLD